MSNKTIILKGYTSNRRGSFPADKYFEGSNNILIELELPIKEADLRIIPHVQHAIKQGRIRVIVTSNNTDVVVLLIHYYRVFQSINFGYIIEPVKKHNIYQYIDKIQLLKKQRLHRYLFCVY